MCDHPDLGNKTRDESDVDPAVFRTGANLINRLDSGPALPWGLETGPLGIEVGSETGRHNTGRSPSLKRRHSSYSF